MKWIVIVGVVCAAQTVLCAQSLHVPFYEASEKRLITAFASVSDRTSGLGALRVTSRVVARLLGDGVFVATAAG